EMAQQIAVGFYPAIQVSEETKEDPRHRMGASGSSGCGDLPWPSLRSGALRVSGEGTANDSLEVVDVLGESPTPLGAELEPGAG
ncbi:hypothetical protein KDA82_41530, partial [Streptomyces daliensis]|nr:hypothetical protein [Streptomyces daliensis]